MVLPSCRMGSPPRRRGKEVADEGIGGIIRITPAWAGKSCPAARMLPRTRDHPRVGGEKATGSLASTSRIGSPPRRRGKALHRVKNDLRYGITPAWAGKSTVVLPTPGYLWDHPRVGGEKLVFHVGQRGQRGSPPRGRGKVFDPYFLEYGSKDHPRVGGEKLLQFALPLLLTGSPPRGRGKGFRRHRHEPGYGITPAWAGKREPGVLMVWQFQDHPRVGGEKG